MPFPSSYSFAPDPVVTLPSLTFERASVLYNIASVLAGLGAAENRADSEGIRKALAYLQASRRLLPRRGIPCFLLET